VRLICEDKNTDNCNFLIQEGGKTRSFRSIGKEKDGIAAVPLTGDHVQTRLSK